MNFFMAGLAKFREREHPSVQAHEVVWFMPLMLSSHVCDMLVPLL